jgi:hypothetical protein
MVPGAGRTTGATVRWSIENGGDDMHGWRMGVALLATTVCAPAVAQTATPPATTAPSTTAAAPVVACSTAAYRQFDFWLGDWVVHGGPDGGQLQGTSRIERSGNGCWLVEHWHSARGSDGTSLNAWDAQYKVWRQFWTGADGVVLRLEGGLQDGAMVMVGELPRAQGGMQLQRIRWTPDADGSVEQRWETSDDAGASWQVAFLGRYTHPGSE